MEQDTLDEIGVLIGVFNDMLAGIQFRDEKLRDYREHLEEQVADRTMDLIQANELLQTAKEAAESANRAKSEFLANMSHEIRTPMNTVLGFTDLLKSLITDKRQKHYLEAIAASGKGLLALINGILDLSKIEAGKMELQKEPVNLYAVFDEIQHIFTLHANEKSVDFSVTLDPDIPPSMMLDEVRLKQILFNLIGNAVKFTQQGYIRVSVEKTDSPGTSDGIDLSIIVEDTGIGIPKQFHDEIFEAFRQKDGQSTKRYGGTGLGLSITKRLVEMMGGTISVDSAENRGSRFSISIPYVQLARDDVANTTDTTFNPEDVSFQEATVLIADDVPTNRMLIREFVRSAPITLIEADNDDDAVLLSRQHQPDVILMDLRIPVAGAANAMKNLRENPATRSIPVIALTASGMEGEKEMMVKEGFAGYLIKPIRKATLFRELSRFLPHSCKEEPIEASACSDSETYDSERLSKVIETLENTLAKTWSESRQNQFFDAIGEFADRIIQLGEANSITLLTAYGEDLRGHVESFDVENMNTTLDTYPELIERIKALNTKDDMNEIHQRNPL
jgi:two-component system sensor histidine kinase EvgS